MLATDFRFYAEHVLKLRPPQGGLVPFIPSEQQMKLHEVAERQLRTKGRVRIIVAKGRKTGTSTYVQGRFFKQVTQIPGIKAFVAAHDAATTAEIFEMADRFNANAPADLIPKATSNSAKELAFKSLDSGYGVGTAGSKNVGRGFTPQLLHLSEAAYYDNAADIARGLMTGVADVDGTEIWIESTGNGPGDWFHSQCMAAIAGKSDFELVFLEWWLEPQYASNDDIQLTEEEERMLATYPRLTKRNLAWRRKKISSYGADGERLFRREYPMSVADVFSDAEGAFIPPEIVDAAVQRELEPDGPLVVGVDPGGGGTDPTAVVARKGRKFLGRWLINERDPTFCAGMAAKVIETLRPVAVFIDVIGVGYHLKGILETRFPGVRGVDFRRTAIEERRFVNKRAECYDGMKEWLTGASIPDDQLLRSELSVFKYKYLPNGQLRIESKEDAKERGNNSPNIADALAITFSEPVENGLMDADLWRVWRFKAEKDSAKAEQLPELAFLTLYAWHEDDQWAIAAVGVFVPDIDTKKSMNETKDIANAIILRCITGAGVYDFLENAEKLWNKYEPDYFYIPARASILLKDLRGVRNLMVRKAAFERVDDVVAVGASVLKQRVAWVRNSQAGNKLRARLSRFPHGDDQALYGCIGLALAHLKVRGNIATQWQDDEEDDERATRRKRRRERSTAY